MCINKPLGVREFSISCLVVREQRKVRYHWPRARKKGFERVKNKEKRGLHRNIQSSK